jgi:hypothetical protein
MIPRRPVIEQHETENMLLCVFNWHSLTPRHRFGDEVPHFELEVEFLGWAVSRL